MEGDGLMTSSNGNIFRVTGSLSGESTGDQWIPLTKASDAELWFLIWSAPNERLSKQSRRRWLETQSRSLLRQCNAQTVVLFHSPGRLHAAKLF